MQDNTKKKGLKPCPFCGRNGDNLAYYIGFVENTETHVKTYEGSIECLNCNASITTDFIHFSYEEAENAVRNKWNERV